MQPNDVQRIVAHIAFPRATWRNTLILPLLFLSLFLSSPPFCCLFRGSRVPSLAVCFKGSEVPTLAIFFKGPWGTPWLFPPKVLRSPPWLFLTKVLGSLPWLFLSWVLGSLPWLFSWKVFSSFSWLFLFSFSFFTKGSFKRSTFTSLQWSVLFQWTSTWGVWQRSFSLILCCTWLPCSSAFTMCTPNTRKIKRQTTRWSAFITPAWPWQRQIMTGLILLLFVFATSSSFLRSSRREEIALSNRQLSNSSTSVLTWCSLAFSTSFHSCTVAMCWWLSVSLFLSSSVQLLSSRHCSPRTFQPAVGYALFGSLDFPFCWVCSSRLLFAVLFCVLTRSAVWASRRSSASFGDFFSPLALLAVVLSLFPVFLRRLLQHHFVVVYCSEIRLNHLQRHNSVCATSWSLVRCRCSGSTAP